MDIKLDLTTSSSSEFSDTEPEDQDKSKDVFVPIKKQSAVPEQPQVPKIRAPTPCMDEKPINTFIQLLSMLAKATNKTKEPELD